MEQEIALDQFLISRPALAAWNNIIKAEIRKLRGNYLRTGARAPTVITGARVNSDETLTLYFKVPEVIDVSVNVAAGHWRHKI